MHYLFCKEVKIPHIWYIHTYMYLCTINANADAQQPTCIINAFW